jgi:hypothetical protein
MLYCVESPGRVLPMTDGWHIPLIRVIKIWQEVETTWKDAAEWQPSGTGTLWPRRVHRCGDAEIRTRRERSSKNASSFAHSSIGIAASFCETSSSSPSSRRGSTASATN